MLKKRWIMLLSPLVTIVIAGSLLVPGTVNAAKLYQARNFDHTNITKNIFSINQAAPAPTNAVSKPTTGTTANTTTTKTVENGSLSAEEQALINLVNKERTQAGLPPLKVDLQLVKLAEMKSQDMINKGYFAHESPTYGSPFNMMRTYGVTYKTAGENLAGNRTIEQAHTALMGSPGHRQNILNPAYTHIGIGVVNGGPYGKMITEMFVGR